MKNILICLLVMLCSYGCTNHKRKPTRSFKLTKDSTFIGAWGGVRKNYPHFPLCNYHLVFIYSKNNKIYVPYYPEYYDTTKDEKEMLGYYYSSLGDSMGTNGWNKNFIVESETQMTEYGRYGALDERYRYKIDDSNNLIYSKEYWEDYYGADTSYTAYYIYKPYYFKTISNPKEQ